MQQKIFDIASEVLGVTVSETTTMANMPTWDSLRMLQIIMALDEAGISIPIEKITEIKGATDLVKFAKV